MFLFIQNVRAQPCKNKLFGCYGVLFLMECLSLSSWYPSCQVISHRLCLTCSVLCNRPPRGHCLARRLLFLPHQLWLSNSRAVKTSDRYTRLSKLLISCSLWYLTRYLTSVYNLSQYLTNLMHKIFFTSFISCLYMFRAHVLIIRRPKLHYKAFGIITPIGVMIPGAVMMSTCARNM